MQVAKLLSLTGCMAFAKSRQSLLGRQNLFSKLKKIDSII